MNIFVNKNRTYSRIGPLVVSEVKFLKLSVVCDDVTDEINVFLGKLVLLNFDLGELSLRIQKVGIDFADFVSLEVNVLNSDRVLEISSEKVFERF